MEGMPARPPEPKKILGSRSEPRRPPARAEKIFRLAKRAPPRRAKRAPPGERSEPRRDLGRDLHRDLGRAEKVFSGFGPIFRIYVQYNN